MTPQFSENNIYGSQNAVFADARSLGNTVSMNNVLHNVIDLKFEFHRIALFFANSNKFLDSAGNNAFISMVPSFYNTTHISVYDRIYFIVYVN